MNNLAISKFAVQELDSNEMINIEGGALPFWLIPVAIYLYDNREQYLDGIKDGLRDVFLKG